MQTIPVFALDITVDTATNSAEQCEKFIFHAKKQLINDRVNSIVAKFKADAGDKRDVEIIRDESGPLWNSIAVAANKAVRDMVALFDSNGWTPGERGESPVEREMRIALVAAIKAGNISDVALKAAAVSSKGKTYMRERDLADIVSDYCDVTGKDETEVLAKLAAHAERVIAARSVTIEL